MSEGILTRSAALKKVLRTLEKVAAAKTPVLIEGESGVGKERLAQHLHRLSPRANKAQVDLVEVADGGTLFLDEVGEMAAEIQSKFLRVLDSGTFYRVGATRKRRADFRLVAATNRGLRSEVAAGRFRKDLFYRIHGVQVVIPPLRERPEDIPLLVEHFSRALPQARQFSPAALRALAMYDWPGNVRELHFAVERACLLAEGKTIESTDLPPEIVERARRLPLRADGGATSAAADLLSQGDGPDPVALRQALKQARWRREEAAKILGVSPRTLRRWMKKTQL